MLTKTPLGSSNCRVGLYLSRRWKTYDVAVLGGGPGGYVAAIKAAQQGMSVACIEERPRLGGTCLNVGCIPTKALLNMSHKLHDSKHHTKFGFTASATPDLQAMNKIKEKTVDGLAKGIAFLFKKNKIDLVVGRGKLASATSIDVANQTVSANNIILATGSCVASMPGDFLVIDEKKVLSSTGALELTQIPKKMIVVGGGAIGLEFASLYSRLGTEVHVSDVIRTTTIHERTPTFFVRRNVDVQASEGVTMIPRTSLYYGIPVILVVVEFMPQIAVGMDKNVADELMKILQQQKIKFHLNHKVVGADVSQPGVKIFATSAGESIIFEGDVVLVSVGRRPNSENLGLQDVGVEIDKQKRVVVDEYFRTSVPSVRAIGDLIHGPMLAHKAEEDAVACVEALKEHEGHKINYDDVPAVIYTYPEVASFGPTEEKLISSRIPYTKGQFPFAANSRAKANQEPEGFAKILSCKTTGRILGGSIIAPNAGDLIQTLAVAKAANMTATNLGNLMYPHPCLTEAIKEASLLAGTGKTIHM